MFSKLIAIIEWQQGCFMPSRMKYSHQTAPGTHGKRFIAKVCGRADSDNGCSRAGLGFKFSSQVDAERVRVGAVNGHGYYLGG